MIKSFFDISNKFLFNVKLDLRIICLIKKINEDENITNTGIEKK